MMFLSVAGERSAIGEVTRPDKAILLIGHINVEHHFGVGRLLQAVDRL